MARTKQTRPQAIIAARRVRLPEEPKKSGDISAAKRAGRLLKQLGIAGESLTVFDNSDSRAPKLPRVTVQRARKGHCHPAGKRDIEALLLALGELTFYGVREIRLAQKPATARSGGMLFGRLYIPGKIVLYVV